MENKSDQATHDYVIAHSSYEPEVLQQLYRETWAKIYAPQMIAGHMQGSLLRMISQMINPKNILEIGTFTGYSAICLAVGLQADGRLHTIELNREFEEIAARYIEMAGLSEKITRHFGDAREIIPTLDIVFDLVYIDAAKEFYVEFYEMAMERLCSGGFILADNALWYGKVADPAVMNDKDTDAIRKFNFHVQCDLRTENLLLPFRDGIMLIRKK